MSETPRRRPVTLAIVSRQEVVARGLTAMLADYPDRVIVTALSSTYAKAVGVEVILYDTLGLHRSDGDDLRHLIEGTDARVIVYARDMRPDLRARALAMGAEAWVSMSTRAKELVEAVELAASGRAVPPPEPLFGDVGLSRREEEVVSFIAQGLSNDEIAERLVVSLNTLKSQIRSAYSKMGVSSRAQAVAWALQHGFTPYDG